MPARPAIRALDTSVTSRTYAGSRYYASAGRMFNLDYAADIDTLLDLIYNTETSSATQGFYAMQDIQAASATTITPSDLHRLEVSGSAASDRMISLPTTGAASSCQNWEHKTGAIVDNYGWYFNFPEGGERVIGDPKVGIGHVAFSSNVMSANSCSAASYS